MRPTLVLLTLFSTFGGLALAEEPIHLQPFVVSSATGERTPAPIMGDTSLGFLNTPRSYVSVGQRDLEEFSVGGLPQLASISSASVQLIGTYGHTATLNVRGDMGELYQNGQRRTNNAAGFQPSFNGVTQVDVVKGAAPVVFGPGFYSGGYLNLQTKRAGQIPFTGYSLTVGSLGEYTHGVTVLGVDSNLPLNTRDAIRVSYQGQVDQTEYPSGRNDSQDIYLTFSRSLKDSTLEVTLQGNWQAAPQIEGINRVTQRLIDHREYLSDGGLVKLKPTDNLVSPGDFSNANVLTAQAIYSQATFKSLTLVESVNRRRFNAFAYAEYVKQLTVDQRLEWHWDTGESYTLAGLNGRAERRESYTNYFNAFFPLYDITKGGVRQATDSIDYYPGMVGPGGRLFFGPLDGNTDTTLSHLYQVAPFAQHRMRLGQWQVLYGGRADGYRVFVIDPLTRSVKDRLSTYSTSYMASIMRDLNGWHLYGTYAHLRSVNGTVSGGGIVFGPDLKINEDNLRSLNRLYEVGLRRESQLGQLSLTAFWQERQQPDLYAYKPNDIKVRGVELEATKRWRKVGVTQSVTYNEGNFINSQPFELPSAYLDTVTQPGNYRIPGLSRVYWNSILTYTGTHWGAALVRRYQSEQSGNGLGGYHIPSQVTLDGQLSYRRGPWSATLNVTNLMNRFHFIHNGDSFGDSVVIHRAPLLGSTLTIRYTH